jgi:hypothetical protein
MATPDINAIRNARVAFRSIRRSLLLALDDVGTTQAALDAGKRIYAPNRPELVPLQTARDNAIGAAAGLRSAEKNARGAISTAISNWVTGISVDTDVARMTTNGPIVLFPIRIETRFGVDGNPPTPVLRVRIYPDEIFINLHEPAITRAERDAGIRYYTLRDQQGGDENGELWRQLLDTMTPERAAYVLRLLTPNFSGGTSTGTSSASVGPEFPTDYALKQSDFSRPAEAVLPDRWIVRTVSGTTSTDYPGKPIPEPLIMTPDPQKKEPSELFQIPGSNPALFVDDEIAWTVDYQRALDVGMAVTIPLTATQATPGTGGFDKIMVFGVKTSFDQNDTTVFLDQLFDDHHYTRGLALVPQGTPTNNTEDEPTSLPISDPDGSISFNVERKPTAPSPLSSILQDTSLTLATDGNRLSRILGIHSGVFANVAGARGGEQAAAVNMATLLWPTTYGYVVEQLMAPLFTPNQHDQIRDYFLSNVRACGPAPAFRIGQVPYGVLPALSVVNWQQRGSTLQEQFENAARTTMLHCREAWKTAALLNVPKVTPSAADPLADLLDVLALAPSAQVMFARQSTGPIATLDLFNWYGIDYQTALDEGKSIVADLLGRIAQANWATALLAQITHSDTSKQVAIPLIALPEAIGNIQIDPLVAPLFAANITDLINDNVNVPAQFKETVFYKLARMALLEAKIRRSVAVIKANPGGIAAVFLEVEVELNQSPVPFAPLLLFTGVPGTNGPLGDSTTVRNDPQVQAVYGALLSTLITPAGQLERLFAETLDLCSHRLDAWLTGFATRRLLEMRTAQQTSGVVPVGNYFGGYAFVENVRPVARTTTNLTGYGTVEIQDGNGGFVHAPSLSHATAGTILRNGYMSYHDESPSKYAFDLSSARVRAAREIFGEIRAGQPLGAVFGYRFERGVAQNYPVNLGLNQYRYALRNYFPLVANKAGGPSTVPNNIVATIAARNVVDGLALWNAFQANTIPWDTAPDLPRRTIVVNGQTVPNPPYTALATELNKLGDIIDAVSDLNIGEGLLQLARGNVSAAAGNLDSLARGTPPPDPETAVSQRGGTPASHRVALTFTGAGIPISPGDGWTGTLTPRANASLTLDNWAGRILGNPTLATAHITLDPVDPTTGTATSVDISLADLGLRPLDVVAIARASATANAGSILDRRFAAAAAQFLANNNDATHKVGAIAYNPPPTPPANTPQVGPASIPQVMEVARAIGALVGGARNLTADDLSSSIDSPDARKSTDPANKPLVDDQSDIATHAGEATGAINAIITSLTSGTGLAAALVAAADYFADAFPAPGSTDASLAVTIAPTIAAELKRRVKAAADAVQALGSTAGVMAAQRVEQFRALFGNDFLVLPPFFPPNPAELGLSLGAGTTLLPQSEDANSPQQFLQQAAQIYEGLGRFRTLSLYMGALNLPPLRMDMAQLPHAGEPWIGLKFANRTTPLPAPLPGRQSLLLFSPSTLAPAASDIWQGIVVQDWVEVIPNNTETTGLGFNFDNPGAEAAQAILVIPPSTTGANWKTSDIWATLSETFDLARIRAVDLELVGGFGQFLPAIYASNNIALQTASTSFAASVFDVPLF